jgi:uncharacterized protein (DUF697 family)
LLPLPLLDVALVTGIQVKMVSDLAKLYGVAFEKEVARSAVTALLAALVPAAGRQAALWVSSSALKSIPLVGTLLGTVASTVLAGVVTRALGRVYAMHFEAGGTLLDLHPAAMHSYFREALSAEAEVAVEAEAASDVGFSAEGASASRAAP